MRARIVVIAATAAIGCLLAVHPWDRDGDGDWNRFRSPVDCDDADPVRGPSAADTPANGVDENCDGRDSFRGANVLFILIDALRPDVLAAYGGDTDSGVALKKLADRSVLYADAVAQSSCTKPSLPSMFTSRLPSQLYAGLFAPETEHVPVDFPRRVRTLPELLKGAGYVTVGYAANPLLRQRWGAQRGFAYYRFVERPCQGFENYGTAAAIRELAVNWLEKYTGSQPFFMYLHLMDVHTRPCPLTYKATSTGLELLRRQYHERLAYVDAEIGQLLDALDRLDRADDTIVVITADHGEELGDHQGMRHCQTLYEESVRIPLLFTIPGRDAGERIATPVRALDIVPTLLTLLEIPFDAGQFEGLVLPPFASEIAARPIISQRPGQAALREDGWKLIEVYPGSTVKIPQYGGADVLLFDLVNDPKERTNLRDAHPERVEAMRRRLAEVQGSTDHAAQGTALSREERATLRALGYIE
jgi:arylsulfatase A-like enzyme